jgi:hypothetical protein
LGANRRVNRRRVSFFSPSPAANLVGVTKPVIEEGHLMLQGAFFVL